MAAASPAGGLPAAPCFLLPLADSILAAGKSALLLAAYSNWRVAAAAAAARPGAAPLPAIEVASPSKRRLSEYSALGFAVAGQHAGGQAHPYGVPPPAAPALADAGLALLGGGGGDAPAPEPLLLHQQLVRNLEVQLLEQLEFGGSSSSPAPLKAARVASLQQPSTSASSDGSHACHEEWLQAGAACDGHMLLLPDEDSLPPLPPVPASAEQLPAAQLATIGAWAGHPSAAPSSQHSSGLSIADRMQAAAEARVAQASGAAMEQLPLLIIPPAPLQALAAAAAATPGSEGGAAAAARVAAAAEEAQRFDGSAWQQWYQQVSTSLSQQLQVLDRVPSSDGRTGSAELLAGSCGAPLGLPRYAGGSLAEQLWGRGGADAGMLGGTLHQALQPQLASAAPPLDVLLQHSLLRPLWSQVDAASGALCASLLRHGLMRQVGGGGGSSGVTGRCWPAFTAMHCHAAPATPSRRALHSPLACPAAGGAARHLPAGVAAAGALCFLPAAPHQVRGCCWARCRHPF